MSGPEGGNGWRRLHPLTPLLRSVQLLYALALGAFAAWVSAGARLVIPLALLAAAGAALSIIAYLRFRYRLTDENLLITHGIMVRRRRVIPRSRIQNVDLRAGLLQQVLGTTTARIETAGGRGTEALLHVVSKAEGSRLRRVLVESRQERASLAEVPPEWRERRAGEAQPIVPPGDAGDAEAASDRVAIVGDRLAGERASEPGWVYRVGLIDLIIAGATSNRAGVLVGALLGGDYMFDFMPTDWLLRRFLRPELVEPGAAVDSLVETASHDVGAFITVLFVLGIAFAVAGWGLSVAASVARFFDFTLRWQGDELQVSYGLFTRQEKSLRRARVQNVQVEEPILRRWLGLASLRLQTAGYGPGVKASERVETLAPILRRGELGDYLSSVLPGLVWDEIEWRPSHPRSRRRLFMRRALVVVVATGVLALNIGMPGLFLLLGLAPAWILARAHYRHLGHARAGDYVLVREGLWTRRTFIVPIRRIQALHLRQSPFQRRLGLGTLSIETAGNPYEWHGPRGIDLGRDYGEGWMECLATRVAATGITF